MRIVVGSDAFGTHGGTHGTRRRHCQIDVRVDRGIVYQMIATKPSPMPWLIVVGRPDLNSSFASFQSPSGDFAMPLI